MGEEKKTGEGLSLLKRGQKGIIHAVFSRMGIMFVLLVVQVMFLFSIFRWFRDFLPHVLGGTMLFTVIMVLYLLNSRMDPTAKITWLVVIMLLPVFGALFYWYIQSDLGHKAMKKRIGRLLSETRGLIPQLPETLERLEAQDPGGCILGTLSRPEQRPGL